ncbi:hypothetical protein FF011L_11110 [Roseimaritima multifibrata]|uniref:Uncharacterized protein n=1 Tax=Roseimaritima multifibrata TaxID=1930274 RepID=A0A517MBU9_9BACT|nr:hypothetical protein [Roseimaritima multifibrata]QDS92368.1 hypothetical protein FF011L_11110 [Roseimaritima multifibrata]
MKTRSNRNRDHGPDPLLKVCTNELRHEERSPVKVASNESRVDDHLTVESRVFGNKVVVALVASDLIGTIEHMCRL